MATGGTKSGTGDRVAWSLSSGDSSDCILRLLEYYRSNAKSLERIARSMDRYGGEK